jgi:hypothetical protein
MATSSRSVFRLKTALQTVKFYKNPALEAKKTPAQASSGVCLGTVNLFFLVLALGGLERIHFGTRLRCGRTDVRGHVAVANLPFERRIGTG